jgi:hypothetical protein
MNRCVAIHSNGTSEVVDVQPRVHRELRGLCYRRFVLRTADGRSPLTSAVYARTTPTSWQIVDAARKLWGRNTNAVHVFDEHGEPLAHDGSPGMTTGEMQVIDATVSDAPVAEATVTDVLATDAPAPAPAAPVSTAASPLATETRSISRIMLEDVRRAAREIRGALASRRAALDEANELRALADRLEGHARSLESQLSR